MTSKLGSKARRELSMLLACLAVTAAINASTAMLHDEREVRSAYVFNLVKYIDWPTGSNNEIVIGYYGDAETGAVMRKMLDGRNSDARTIRVLVLPTEDQLARCSVVYFASTDQTDARTLLEKLKTKNVLTIGESEAFTQGGGVIALVKADDHIQIRVNLEAAQRAGVHISSRVLNLATIVHSAQNARN